MPNMRHSVAAEEYSVVAKHSARSVNWLLRKVLVDL